eukprot:tig00020851_g14700.t1
MPPAGPTGPAEPERAAGGGAGAARPRPRPDDWALHSSVRAPSPRPAPRPPPRPAPPRPPRPERILREAPGAGPRSRLTARPPSGSAARAGWRRAWWSSLRTLRRRRGSCGAPSRSSAARGPEADAPHRPPLLFFLGSAQYLDLESRVPGRRAEGIAALESYVAVASPDDRCALIFDSGGARGAAGQDEDEGSCAACGVDGCSLRCGRCRSEFYCSPECQRAHWREHKAACRPAA